MKEQFRLYNTLSRSEEQLVPLKPGEVSIYTCGPTVYNDQHIGNYRTFVLEDLLVKSLRRAGFRVNRVMNITDVGHLVSDEDEGQDKLEVGAQREGKTAWEIAEKYTEHFVNDLQEINAEVPTLVKATDKIQEQIVFISKLESLGYTYTTSDGVYFDTTKLENYGELARLDVTGMEAGIRVSVGEKKSKTDFALWKFSGKPGERHMEWESPWGLGFPGWHIECSAIIKSTLGDTIDIHCGGVDHIPVHHPNEIAQSETVNDAKLANIWFHVDFLQVDGGKMAKSLGNVYTIADLKKRGYDPLAIRLFYYSANYRSKQNFTWEELTSAQQSLRRLRLAYQQSETAQDSPEVQVYLERFDTALASDLNTPVALSVVWDAVQNLEPAQKRFFLQEVDAVLSLNLAAPTDLEEAALPAEIQALLEERAAARANKDFTKSDEIRDILSSKGYQVLDTPTGQKLEKTLPEA